VDNKSWAPQISHVVIFANWYPDKSKLSLDRWDIRTIDSDDDCLPWESCVEDKIASEPISINTLSEPVIVGGYGSLSYEDDADDDCVFGQIE